MEEAKVAKPLNLNQLGKIWKEFEKTVEIYELEPNTGEITKEENMIRFVCISDTHGLTSEMLTINQIPEGDVLIHAGDFTDVGRISDIKKFNDFLGSQPHPHKIVIAGNHDLSLDSLPSKMKTRYSKLISVSKNPPEYAKSLLTNCTYLEDSSTTCLGYKIYGSPWQPTFCNWGFNLPRGQKLLDKWQLIPADTDILITHGPPLGFGDILQDCRKRTGCYELLKEVRERVKPLYHVFGHIHEGYGVWREGGTTYVNASTCNLDYNPENRAIVFDLPLIS